MKIEQEKPKFSPVHITLENEWDLLSFQKALDGYKKMETVNIPPIILELLGFINDAAESVNDNFGEE